MKTVKDYKQLGLVFIQGDYINTFYGKKENPLNRSGVKNCNNSVHNDEKFAIEFAWRNNDGVKPEYKGAMEVELDSSDVIFNCGKTSEFDWRINDDVSPKIIRWRPIVISDGISGCWYSFAISECQKPSFLQQKPKINLIVPDSLKSEVRRVGSEINVTISQKDKQENAANNLEQVISIDTVCDAIKSVVKSRQVVLQSDDAQGSNDEPFRLPVGIDSPELREAFKSLKEHLESKPPLWNKSIQTLNCPCVAVNVEVIKPTVSPKEDKPMKPVYTAEMHAKNELPQEYYLLTNKFNYNPATGLFTNKKGEPKGWCVQKKNKTYIKIYFNGKGHYAQRLAWLYMTGQNPNGEIDHIDGDSENNAISNLRDVDRKTNCMNVRLHAGSVSGFCGVNWHEPSKKWRARVKINGKEVFIGLFDDPEVAAKEIKHVREAHGFHPNHGESRDNRTPKQKAVDEMLEIDLWATDKEFCEALYKAGYRKYADI